MSICAGLVGLPNVGKSTLFNALTKSSVPAENYPFCTIDPHMACTSVLDKRIPKLQQFYKSPKIIPATVQFVDIAGLVKGAASGEGLGNQFLSHIREVDLILHILRCFDDPNITYSRPDEIDPLVDYEIIMTELMFKDLESIDKRKQKAAQLTKSSKNNAAQLKELTLELELLEKLTQALNEFSIEKVQTLIQNSPVSTVPLLSAKNFLIIANVSETEIADAAYKQNRKYQQLVEKFGENRVIPISARLEYELSQLNAEEQEEMAHMMGLAHRGLDTIIDKTYEHLGLITFFTCGPKEIHAWPIKANTSIRQAAGEIHSDLEKGFICAEVFNCNDLFEYQSEHKLKEAGKLRIEGQDYKVQNGDIVHIRFNV
jgi:ribosome-binding ATPase